MFRKSRSCLFNSRSRERVMLASRRSSNALSNRVSCVGVLPLRDPKAAAEELRRGVTELGLRGFEILPMGLPMGLGRTFYDPVYAEAEKLGAVIGIHGSS